MITIKLPIQINEETKERILKYQKNSRTDRLLFFARRLIMEDKARQDELISTLEKENYDEEVIKQVKDDLEAGLSVEQVSIYKVRRLKAK